jgi:HK97 gp10 family phage protein
VANVQFTDNSDKFKQELSDKIPAILEAIGIHLEGEAKDELENDPRRVDTGLLRNSITHAISGGQAAKGSYKADKADKSGNIPSGSYSGTAPSDPPDAQAVYIGTNVEYGIYVHEGTNRMAPNRFLKNAVERNKDQISKYIKDNLKN